MRLWCCARQDQKREAAEMKTVLWTLERRTVWWRMCATMRGRRPKWEKTKRGRRRRKSVWRLCGRRGEWGRTNWLGQRFLMGAGNRILALLGFVLGVQWCRGMRLKLGFFRGCSVRRLGVQGYAVKKHSKSYI